MLVVDKLLGLRTVIYSFVLFFGIVGMTFSILTIFINQSDVIFPSVAAVFGIVCSALNLFVWIGASILLSYNERPRSTRTFTTFRAHFIACAAFAFLLLVCGILFATLTPENCDFSQDWTNETCGMMSTSLAMSWVNFLLSAAMASALWHGAPRYGGMSANVALTFPDSRLKNSNGIGTEEMSSQTELRTMIYSLVLFFGVVEMTMAISTILVNRSFDFPSVAGAFGVVGGILSGGVWIWVSVLLSYNNRPLSTGVLTKFRMHFVSFGVFTLIWLFCGILFATQMPENCDLSESLDGYAYTTCGFMATALALAWLEFLLCAVGSFVLWAGASRSGGMDVNVAAYDNIDGVSRDGVLVPMS